MYKRKKLYTAVLMSAMLSASMLSACGNQSTEETETEAVSSVSEVSESSSETVEATVLEQYAGQTVFGTIVETDGNEITMNVMGSMDTDKMSMEMPSEDMNPGEQQGEAPTDAGTAQSSEQPPEKPEGEDNMGQVGGEAPAIPDQGTNEGQPGGDVPEKPEGEDNMGQAGGEAPAMPDQGTDANQPGSDAPDAAPEKPEGDSDTDQQSAGTPDSAQAQPSEAVETVSITFVIADESVITDTEGSALTLDELQEGDSLQIVVDEDGFITAVVSGDMAGMGMNGGAGMSQPGGMGASSGVDSYTAVNEYTTDTEIDGETFTSTGTDENAALVSNGANVTLSNVAVTRTSDSSTGGDNSSFYGVGAALLVTDGTLTVKNSDITTDAAGGAGVFAYGSGTAYVYDSTIITAQNTSGGIHVAGGGTLYAENLTVETNGESAAAIRSDRGGGTMSVNGGSYTSNGVGSPAVYCTADISIANAQLTATGSEAVCIEGLNSLSLTDCALTGNMSDSSQNDCTWTVIVYQSMSGDSEVGNGTFSMTGGELISGNGGLFYTTNTECTIYLSGVTITPSDDNAFLLQCTGNTNQRGWGSSGNNGSQCTFTADAQTMSGDVIYDSISTLDMTLQNGSSLTGAIYDDETWAGNGGSGYCNVTIDESSSWIVTADSTVSHLQCSGQIVDSQGNSVTIIGTDGTVYAQGTGSVTITVGSYN